jgi:ankyrin repeat protein
LTVSEATTAQTIVDELVGNAHGNLARVQELVEAHPELVNAKATWNETPIEAATQMGNRAIIDFLVASGAPVDFFTGLVLGEVGEVGTQRANSRGIHELPALYFAAIGGYVDVARRLLDAGADVNAQAEAAAPIHGAVMGKSPEMVTLLLERGADTGLKDYAGRDARALALELKRADLAALFA